MSRIGETFACNRCGAPVVRASMRQRFCRACHDARKKESWGRSAEKNRLRNNESARRRAWARRRAAERVEAMLRKERLLSEIGRDSPTRVYVWRGCVVEWRGTAPNC